MNKEMDYDEEGLGEKIKNKGSIIGIIGVGILGFIHVLSHVIPAIGALGLSQIERHEEIISVFGYNIAPILTNPIMQIAYLLFVPLSFYYIYRDHMHHRHEREVRRELGKAKKELELLKRKL